MYGVDVPHVHVPRLVTGLTQAGTPAAHAAAMQIADARARQLDSAGPLTVEKRDALYALLSTFPLLPQGLRPLHHALAKDHHARHDGSLAWEPGRSPKELRQRPSGSPT